MMELPCKKLHCELLKRLSEGVKPSDFTMTIDEMKDKTEGLIHWFSERNIPLKDALGILEIFKAICWDEIARQN